MLRFGCCHQFIIELHVQYISCVAGVESPQAMSVLKNEAKYEKILRVRTKEANLFEGQKKKMDT